ncbi:unnamed protein product [Trichobilharzia szidati]|nr:unnamed protein product [Trichobilharzia szidati]
MSSGTKSLKRKPDEPVSDQAANKPTDNTKGVSKRPLSISPIKLNIPAQEPLPEIPKRVNSKLREIFNSDEESEEEEIPTEARIRMRNLGRYCFEILFVSSLYPPI